MQASLHPVPEHPLIPSQASLHPLAIVPAPPPRASLLWAWERAASSWLVFIPNSRDLPSRQARGYLRLLSCSSDPHVSLKENKNILQIKITTACNFLQKNPTARLKSWPLPEVLSCMALGAESWGDARGALGPTPVLLCPPWGLQHSHRHPHVPTTVVYPSQIVTRGDRSSLGQAGGGGSCWGVLSMQKNLSGSRSITHHEVQGRGTPGPPDWSDWKWGRFTVQRPRL